MKIISLRIFIRGIVPLAVCAFLLPTAASAQTTSFTAAGWLDAVLAPGIVCTNALGQVLLRGAVHTERIQGTDLRITGQLRSIGDASYNADGTANVQGTAYLQVGTWDADTNFTPTVGMWVSSYRGVMQTDNSLQLGVAGYGSGGAIDGWRVAETLTRGPTSDPIDFTVPYLYTGTIQPPPVSTNLIFDDFSEGVQGWVTGNLCGIIKMYGTNQQLYTWANWTGCPADWPQNFFAAMHSSARPWDLADGQTLQCQIDLIRMSENTMNHAKVWAGNDGMMYAFMLGQAGVYAGKWTAGDPMTIFWLDNTNHVARTNVVLYMALTRDKGNLIITTRVLDKANQNAVLFERSFVDTPGVDASLTTAELVARTGITTVTLGPDPGAPVFYGNQGGIDVWQFTDGHQPPVEALFDNFLLRLHIGWPRRFTASSGPNKVASCSNYWSSTL